jgi:hypothetical protein
MSDNWITPADLYQQLDAELHFDDDPCPIGGTSGFDREWGQRVFMNPPYSNPLPWVKKAYEESLKGKMVVGLLRVDTSTAWFHDWVLGKAEIRWIRGRLHFREVKGKSGRSPFPSMIVIWDGTAEQRVGKVSLPMEVYRNYEFCGE